MSVPESRTFRFPKSRSKRLADAVKLAKGLPGYKKTKSNHRVQFGPDDSASDELWKLIKIASKWKGATFLFGEEEVDQEAWENSFRADSEEATVVAASESSEQEPEVAEEKLEESEGTQEPEDAEVEKAEEKAEEEDSKVDEAPEEEPVVEEKTEEKAEPEPASESLEQEPEEKPEPEKKAEKKPAEESKKEKKPNDSKPNIIEVNPAPRPEDNSGCGKKVAVLMIAALGLFSILR